MAAIVITFTKLKKLEVSILYVPNSNATKTVCEFKKSSEEACACGKACYFDSCSYTEHVWDSNNLPSYTHKKPQKLKTIEQNLLRKKKQTNKFGPGIKERN